MQYERYCGSSIEDSGDELPNYQFYGLASTESSESEAETKGLSAQAAPGAVTSHDEQITRKNTVREYGCIT